MFPRPLHPPSAQIGKMLQGTVHLPISSRQTRAAYNNSDAFALITPLKRLLNMEKTEAHKLPRAVLNERRRRAVKMRMSGAAIAETVNHPLRVNRCVWG
jgi:hypothetical protein